MCETVPSTEFATQTDLWPYATPYAAPYELRAIQKFIRYQRPETTGF